MELIYFYKKQGCTLVELNFSSEYNCCISNGLFDFSEWKKCSNFYGDRINSLSCIVGENGSGKTTLCNHYFHFLSDIMIHGLSIEYDFLVFYKVDNTLKFISSENIGCEKLKKSEKTKFIDSLLLNDTLYFHSTLSQRDYFRSCYPSNFHDFSEGALIQRFNNFEHEMKYKDFFTSEISSYYTQQNDYIIKFISQINNNEVREHEYLMDLILPHFIELKFINYKSKHLFQNLSNKYKIPNNLSRLLKNTNNSDEIIILREIKELSSQDKEFLNENTSINNLQELKTISKSYDCIAKMLENVNYPKECTLKNYFFNYFLLQFTLYLDRIYKLNIFEYINYKKLKNFKDLKEQIEINNTFSDIDREHINEYLLLCSECYDSLIIIIENCVVKEFVQIIFIDRSNYDIFIKFYNLYRELPVEFQSFNFNFNLSSGEFIHLKLYSNIYNCILRSKNNFLTLVIDEADIGLHPRLQRKFLNNLLLYLNSFLFDNRKIQIILCTHSPIMLSDVRGCDITYLVSSKVIKKDFQTFGTNIHNLYLNSFFLDDTGVIGEFSRRKINETYKSLLNNDKMNLEEVSCLIKELGEKFLKNKLNEAFDIYKKNCSLLDVEKLSKKQLEELKEKIEVKLNSNVVGK